MKALRLAAVLALAAIGFFWGWRAGLAYAARQPDYGAYDPAQLSWAAEGIMERISELEDELDRVRELQQEKMTSLHD